jgi:thiamine-monophosphate kinase
MRIDEIGGEFGLIDRVRDLHAGSGGNGLVLGIGDDAAVVSLNSFEQAVVTTDMLVESVHFRRDWSDPYSIGWKSAAVNLSDVAAMGAVPTFAFISVALTERETVENMDRLYDGFMDCLNRYGARLAGGDTNVSPECMIISVTQMGVVKANRALTRTGARVGDILLVTGTLGDSAGGLALLTEYGLTKAEKVDKDIVNAHRRPQPRVVAARAAAGTGKVHAAMDISDGIVGDVKKLCAASGVGARIDSVDIPISNSLKHAAEVLKRDPVKLALSGGEDYELLLAVAHDDVDDVIAAINDVGTRVKAVGEIVKSGLRITATNSIDELNPAALGWDHFGK